MTRTAADKSQEVRPVIGIDLGGTKIEAIALSSATRGQANTQMATNSSNGFNNRVLARKRIATPREDYDSTIRAIGDLVSGLESELENNTASEIQDNHAPLPSIGIGMPGSIAPKTGLVQNANSTWLNGRRFQHDLAMALGREVRCANDANCFALSEAVDGAGEKAQTVFGVILGTGCGGGLVRDKQLIDGPRAIGGEWGHNPLPWPNVQQANGDATVPEGSERPPDELPGPLCWCGRRGCMETWVSGPALATDHLRFTGDGIDAETIAARAAGQTKSTPAQRHQARQALDRHATRLARGLASIVNVIDPDIIILGGGLSKLVHLYEELPVLMAPYIFAEDRFVQIKPPRWGDASGVRGAAWLWSPNK